MHWGQCQRPSEEGAGGLREEELLPVDEWVDSDSDDELKALDEVGWVNDTTGETSRGETLDKEDEGEEEE